MNILNIPDMPNIHNIRKIGKIGKIGKYLQFIPSLVTPLQSSTSMPRISCLQIYTSKPSCSSFHTTSLQSSRVFLTKNLSPQAMFPTHPHIFKSEDVLGTPFHTKQDFQNFRNKILSQLPDNSFAIIPANEKSLMTNDIPYTFRQDSDFFMATGLHEPNGCLVLEKCADGTSVEHLFLKDRDEYAERWDGATLGVERARNALGFNGLVRRIDELEAVLNKWFSTSNSKFFVQWKNGNGNVFDKTRTIIQYLISTNPEYRNRVITLDAYLNIAKMHKSEADIKMLRRAASISAHAIKQAMKNTRPGLSESHIEAILEFESRIKGAQRLAYPPVIASGTNSIVLHYVSNNQVMKDGDLLLIDAGCEYYLYPSDISRTWPINGKFSEPQRKLYTAILNAQKKLITLCQPHRLTFNELHDISMDLLAEEMINFGIVNGVAKLTVRSHMGAFYPHMIGHPLGIDIHQNFDMDIKFEPGMVITIEPGLYIAARNTSPKDEKAYDILGVPEEYRGLGIRIEDNILITNSGYENLTCETPKEVEEIESIMQEEKDSYTERFEFF